jgi:hypothetical protein
MSARACLLAALLVAGAAAESGSGALGRAGGGAGGPAPASPAQQAQRRSPAPPPPGGAALPNCSFAPDGAPGVWRLREAACTPSGPPLRIGGGGGAAAADDDASDGGGDGGHLLSLSLRGSGDSGVPGGPPATSVWPRQGGGGGGGSGGGGGGSLIVGGVGGAAPGGPGAGAAGPRPGAAGPCASAARRGTATHTLPLPSPRQNTLTTRAQTHPNPHNPHAPHHPEAANVTLERVICIDCLDAAAASPQQLLLPPPLLRLPPGTLPLVQAAVVDVRVEGGGAAWAAAPVVFRRVLAWPGLRQLLAEWPLAVYTVNRGGPAAFRHRVPPRSAPPACAARLRHSQPVCQTPKGSRTPNLHPPRT